MTPCVLSPFLGVWFIDLMLEADKADAVWLFAHHYATRAEILSVSCSLLSLQAVELGDLAVADELPANDPGRVLLRKHAPQSWNCVQGGTPEVLWVRVDFEGHGWPYPPEVNTRPLVPHEVRIRNACLSPWPGDGYQNRSRRACG